MTLIYLKKKTPQKYNSFKLPTGFRTNKSSWKNNMYSWEGEGVELHLQELILWFSDTYI